MINKNKRVYSYHWATDKEYKDIYHGQRCLIVGGGYRGSGGTREYQRCEKLDKFTGKKIGCNSAFDVCDLDILVYLDTSTHVKKKEQLKKFEGLIFVGAPKWDPMEIDFVAVKPRQTEGVAESFNEGIGPRHLSGYFAINIALLLGFNFIFLTGFNSCDASVVKRTRNFAWFRKWAENNGRMIFSTDADGITNDYFEYIPLDNILKREVSCVQA